MTVWKTAAICTDWAEIRQVRTGDKMSVNPARLIGTLLTWAIRAAVPVVVKQVQ
jgi:hypothetical protein